MRLMLMGVLFLFQTAVAQDSATTEPVSETTETVTETTETVTETTETATETTEGTAVPPVVEEVAPAPQVLSEDIRAFNAGAALLQAGPRMLKQACDVFKAVVADYPNTEGARLSQEKIEWMGPDVCDAKAKGNEYTPSSAVGLLTDSKWKEEFITSQALLWPYVLGVQVPLMFAENAGPDIGLAITGGALIGLGVGIGGAYAITKKYELTEGQAMAIYTGQAVGIGHGFWGAGIVGISGNGSVGLTFGMANLGFVLGTGAGVATAVFAKPTAGQMALVRSSGVWGTYFSLLSEGIIPSQTANAAWVRVGLGFDVGMITGAILTQYVDVSRRRMHMINLGGYAGALGGVLLGSFIGLAGVDVFGQTPAAFVTSIAVTSGVGLALGAHLTRNMAGEGRRSGGGMALINHSPEHGWSLGMLTPMVSPGRNGRGPAVNVSIAQGRF